MMCHQIVFAAACALIFIATLSSCYGATAAPLCQPGIIEEMPVRIKKVCVAIENNDQLSNALKSYINNEAATMVSKSNERMDNYDKRTDVDHVFLRFGRRR